MASGCIVMDGVKCKDDRGYVAFSLGANGCVTAIKRPKRSPRTCKGYVPVVSRSKDSMLCFFAPGNHLIGCDVSNHFLKSVGSGVTGHELASCPLVGSAIVATILSNDALRKSQCVSLLHVSLRVGLVSSVTMMARKGSVSPCTHVECSRTFVRRRPDLVPRDNLAFQGLGKGHRSTKRVIRRVDNSGRV